MNLTEQLRKLEVGEAVKTTQKRTGIYTAAKRAGIKVKTEDVEGQVIVTRIGEKLSPVGEAVERVKALPVADRLKVFESFELCCGMNRGACVCDSPN